MTLNLLAFLLTEATLAAVACGFTLAALGAPAGTKTYEYVLGILGCSLTLFFPIFASMIYGAIFFSSQGILP